MRNAGQLAGASSFEQSELTNDDAASVGEQRVGDAVALSEACEDSRSS